MATINHYKVLKVSPDAPAEVIRAAYKVLASKYHPDKCPGDDAAARMMQYINAAYAVLSDPEKRREYDESHARDEGRPDSVSRQASQHPGGYASSPAEPPREPPSSKSAAPKKEPWWASWAPIIVGAMAVKLIGLAGAAVALILYYWLKPRMKWLGASTASLAAGIVVALVANAGLRAVFDDNLRAVSQNQPTAAAPAELTPFTGRLDQHERHATPAQPNPFDAFDQKHQPPTAGVAAQAAAAAVAQADAQAKADAERAHRAVIMASHKDAGEIASSARFAHWLGNNPAYRRIAEQGTANEVVAMLHTYKKWARADDRERERVRRRVQEQHNLIPEGYNHNWSLKLPE